MSYDLKLTTSCDHLVFRELVRMSDRNILRLEKPIATTANIKIFASDNLLPSTLYTIVDDPDQIDAFHNKMVLFKDYWKSPDDNFEVSYLTLANYCAKCVGSGYLDDISYDVRGRFSVLRDEYLLAQNLEKFVITQMQSNPFHTSIGTNLSQLIGTKVTNPSFLTTQITSEISKTLGTFQSLQSQYQRTGRPVTAGELLQSVENVAVTQNSNDPTVWQADVTVMAKSGKTVEFTQYLKIRA